MTAIDRNSKADTRFLSTYPAASVSDLCTDIGQYRTALSNGTTYAYEASSVRTGLIKPRTIEFKIYHTPGDEGYVVYHGNSDATAFTYAVFISKSQVVFWDQDGITEMTVDLDAVSPAQYLVRWACRPGEVSGTTIHECDAYNYGTGEWSSTRQVQDDTTTDAGWQLNLGGYGAGVDVFDAGMDQVSFVRISARYHSREESYQDWVGESTPPTCEGIRSAIYEPYPPEHTHAHLQLTSAGPWIMFSGGYTQRANRAQNSPLLNVRLSDSCILTNAYDPTPWVRKAIGSSLYRWRTDLVFWRPTPAWATHAYVRIFADHYHDVMVDSRPVKVRMYSLDRLPILGQIVNKGQPPPPPVVYSYVSATIEIDQTAPSGGAWWDLGLLKLCRGGSPYGTYFAFAWQVNDDIGDPDEDAQYLLPHQLVCEPVTVPAGESEFGGFDLANP